MVEKVVWARYKMPMKDYIFERTRDDEYRRTKIKLQSSNMVTGRELALAGDSSRLPPAEASRTRCSASAKSFWRCSSICTQTCRDSRLDACNDSQLDACNGKCPASHQHAILITVLHQ